MSKSHIQSRRKGGLAMNEDNNVSVETVERLPIRNNSEPYTDYSDGEI